MRPGSGVTAIQPDRYLMRPLLFSAALLLALPALAQPQITWARTCATALAQDYARRGEHE